MFQTHVSGFNASGLMKSLTKMGHVCPCGLGNGRWICYEYALSCIDGRGGVDKSFMFLCDNNWKVGYSMILAILRPQPPTINPKSDGQELQIKNYNVFNLNLIYSHVSTTMCHRQ